MSRSLLAVAVFVLFIPLSVGAQSQALIEKSQRGVELMAAGKFEEAIPVYRELSQAVPNNPGLLLNLGMALQMAGHSRQAIAPLEHALKLDASTLPAWLFLGSAYLGVGEAAKAIAPLQKYLELQPADPNGHQQLGDALLATGGFQDAAEEFRKLAQMDPGNRRAWYGLNRCYTGLSQSDFQAVEKAAPESAYWLALVGDERVLRRQFRSAFFFYRKAETLQPDLRGLHTSIAIVYQETGHKDWAETEQKKEARLGTGECADQILACDFATGRYDQVVREAARTDTPEALYWRSRTFAALARDAMKRLEQLPEGSEIHELRAELLRARRQHLEAIKEWRLALKYVPNDAHLREELLSSLYQARDYAAALALVDELLRQDPASASLNFTKGDILLSSQETEKAIPCFERALKTDPKLLAAHHALGRAYMLAGQTAAAIPHLQAALSIDEDGSLRYQLSRAYQATGQADLAKKTLAEYQALQKTDRAEKQKLEEELQITAP
jgi:tetratricopeptide (TPR) repeat protein